MIFMITKMMLILNKAKVVLFLIERTNIKNKKIYKDMIIIKNKVVLFKITNLNKK